MTTQTLARTRTPVTAVAAAAVTGLGAAVTGYGAVYFSLFGPGARVSAGSVLFATVFLAVKATAVASAAGMLRGSRTAWQVLLGITAIGEIGFSIVKLVVWHESAALLFGGVSLFVVIPLLLAPATRRHVGAR
jgi:hypothetical protein